MFTIDPNINDKDLKGKSLFKVLISMNNHQVATPETSLEEARSYVFFFREGRKRLSAYIGLHLLLTDRKLIYAHSANPFFEEELSDVESEARDFAEYLGAMMDEVDFAGMSDLEQDSWIEEQDFFSEKKQPEAEPVKEPPQPEVAASAPAAQPAEVTDPASQQPETPVQPTLPAAPAPQQATEPVQPSPTAEAISAPEPPAAPIKPLPKVSPAEPTEQPREDPVTETVQQDRQTQAPLPPMTKSRKEVEQKEAATGIETPPRQPVKKTTFSATSVVSRDREALARLLTSF